MSQRRERSSPLAAVARRGAEIEHGKAVKFEKLLTELSAAFVTPAEGEVDDKIRAALERLGEFLGTQRCGLCQFSEDQSKFRLTHLWSADGIRRDRAVDWLLGDRLPWYTRRMVAQQNLAFSTVDELPPEAKEERQYIVDMGIKSSAIVPLTVGGKVIGTFAVDSMREHRAWPEALLKRLALFGGVFAGAIDRQRKDAHLRKAYEEIKRLKAQVDLENTYLRDPLELGYKHEEIVGRSSGLKEVLLQVEQVAPTNSTVLVQGETGTGKELVARRIHALSRRASRPMIKVNCAALPSTLVESELFGREKGAYTGALSRQTGRFEIAGGSTIFLDEIGELPFDLQAKLLRVLQDGEFERLGSTRTIKVDVRVIAATNRDLSEAVRKGEFREDLFYRLNVFPITVPPLRERPDDILPLVWFFLRQFGQSIGPAVDTIPRKTIADLMIYPWPGNVRELRNVLERAMIRSRGRRTFRVDLSSSGATESDEGLTLDDVQKRHIVRVLDRTRWRVRGKNGAAEVLGMKPTTLEGRMDKLGIRRPVPKGASAPAE